MRRTGTWLGAALLLAGCSASPLDATSVEATLSENVGTVATVTATTEESATIVVEYGPDTTYGAETPASGKGLHHRIPVLGLKPDATWHYRLRVESDGRTWLSDDHTATTDPLPDEVPRFYARKPNDGEAWGRFSLVAWEELTHGENSGVVVLDDDGDVVWYWLPGGQVTAWSDIGPDGAVWLLAEETADDTQEEDGLVRVPLGNPEARREPAPDAHHAVVTDVPDALAAWLVAEPRTVDGETVWGDTIVERGLDGSSRTVWSAWDTLPVETHEGWHSLYYGGDEGDWTHANGLDYDPEEDVYYVSLYYLAEIVKIDRATGEIVWEFGGTRDAFALATDQRIGHIHAPEVTEDGLLLFDNGAQPTSSVAAYTIDASAMTASRTRDWFLPDGASVAVLGEIDALPDGSWYATWGDAHRVTVVGPDDTLHLDLDTEEAGFVLGQGARLDTLYR